MARKAVESKRKSTMSDEHKAALAEGREQGRVVRQYLEALESQQSKRGRKRSTENIAARLGAIDERLTDPDPLRRLQLIQERMDLEAQLGGAQDDGVELDELEAAFVQVAAAYAARKGISYQAWRSVGVAPSVLRAAGIARVN
jgi:hypothetical protein